MRLLVEYKKQKGIISITVLVVIVLISALMVGVALWYKNEAPKYRVCCGQNTNINTTANKNTNSNTQTINQNINNAVISSQVDPQNGTGVIPSGWKTIVLDSPTNSSDEPHNNLGDEITGLSDSITNPFTHERYFIERENGATYCGPNGGTSICNLMRVKNNGTTELVQDLWFPEPDTTPDGTKITHSQYGARLLKFLDANTLQLFFSAADHGGGYTEVSNYSLSDHSLTSVVNYIQAEGSDLGPYTILSYTIEKNDSRIIFQNGTQVYNQKSKEWEKLEMGVYFFTKSGEIKQLNFPAGPYSLSFKIMDNLVSNNVNVTINGVDAQINMEDGSFRYI